MLLAAGICYYMYLGRRKKQFIHDAKSLCILTVPVRGDGAASK